MWTNQIENTVFKRGRQGLLQKGIDCLKRNIAEYPEITGLGEGIWAINDGKGIIAYEGSNYIFTAKAFPFGDIVSVSKVLWDKQKKIRMYLASNDAIYEFDPSKIKETKNNFRGNVEMVNFSIREGINIIKIPAIMALNKPKEVKKVEEDYQITLF